MRAGSSRSRSTATRKCRRRPRSSRSIQRRRTRSPGLTGSDARRRRARSRWPRGPWPAWALAEIARPILGGRGANDVVLYLALYPVGFVFTALYSDGLFLALAARFRFWPRHAGKPSRPECSEVSRPGLGCSGSRSCPHSSCCSGVGRDSRSLARLAPAAAVAGRGRSLRALSQFDARRPLGVHQRPGRLGSRDVAARPARGTARRRPRRRTGCARSPEPPCRGPGT